MKEQLDILVKLQDVEAEAERIKTDLDQIPSKMKSMDVRLKEFDDVIETESINYEDAKKKYRSYETDVKSNLSIIQKYKEQLNSIKSNKEYQALLKSVEDLQLKNSQIEDDMLIYLDQMEQLEKSLNHRKKEYASVKMEIEKERKRLAQDQEKHRKRLDVLLKKEKEVSQQLNPDIMTKFHQIKRQVRGIAVASVSDAICDGCRMKIPPQMYNELQRLDSIKFCPHCQRMIYWKK